VSPVAVRDGHLDRRTSAQVGGIGGRQISALLGFDMSERWIGHRDRRRVQACKTSVNRADRSRLRDIDGIAAKLAELTGLAVEWSQLSQHIVDLICLRNAQQPDGGPAQFLDMCPRINVSHLCVRHRYNIPDRKTFNKQRRNLDAVSLRDLGCRQSFD
jgi:hypothetical protein